MTGATLSGPGSESSPRADPLLRLQETIVFEATEREGTPAAMARLAACYDLAAETLNKVGAT
ncbi:hypothetical protein [Microtetraspora sp. NBRC 16547]|uniref:hypothetical protein n=1 Tax=Microtetraspora sp. NBRC 16547 TaxID=3030993 RepID=UPI0024A1FBC1|nr:hypothetical protein [Microtetraspora sp. NBRC 16547]GLW96072.1 hypothetical protein Misp02_01590 [Microtetraspora sp. NBRC 16547]